MTEYEQLLASRAALKKEMESGGIGEDLSEDSSEGVGEEAIASARGQANPEVQAPGQSKTGGVNMAGDALMTGGAMSGNHYVAGAGLALKTVGMVDDAVRQKEQAKIDAYNKQIMAQRSAIRNVFA